MNEVDVKPAKKRKEKDLSDRLQKLKEELDMVPLVSYEADELAPTIADTDLTWRKSVLEFTPEYHEPISPYIGNPSGSALLYIQAWDVMCSELWTKLEAMLDTPETIDYFNAWMRRRATLAWYRANQTLEKMPGHLIFELEAGSSITEVFEMLVGRGRVEHIWWDQLRWACDYLRIDLNM